MDKTKVQSTALTHIVR